MCSCFYTCLILTDWKEETPNKHFSLILLETTPVCSSITLEIHWGLNGLTIPFESCLHLNASIWNCNVSSCILDMNLDLEFVSLASIMHLNILVKRINQQWHNSKALKRSVWKSCSPAVLDERVHGGGFPAGAQSSCAAFHEHPQRNVISTHHWGFQVYEISQKVSVRWSLIPPVICRTG